MKTTNWKTLAELIGITAIVASLLFLAMEIRQNRQVGRSDTGLTLLQSMHQERELVLANSDVWVRGCRGDELNEVERAQFAHLVRGYGQRIYFIWLTSQDSILGLSNTQPVNVFARNLHRYPGFAAMVRLQYEWFEGVDEDNNPDAQRFEELLSLRLARLRETEPNPEFDPALCGL
jgi:hypothetical protein